MLVRPFVGLFDRRSAFSIGHGDSGIEDYTAFVSATNPSLILEYIVTQNMMRGGGGVV